MVGQPVDVLSQPVGVEPLDGLYDPAVESTPPVLEQAAISDFVGQGMLEGVLKIREEPRLVEELGRLKLGQAPAQRVLGKLGDSLQEPEGHVLADDRGGLQKSLVLR